MNTLAFAFLTILIWSPLQNVAESFHSAEGRPANHVGEVQEVIFSHPAGSYTEEFWLTLTSPDPAYTVVYTLDGSEPAQENLSGVVYTYKNRYPFIPGQPFGPLLTREKKSFVYSEPLRIYDKSPEPDQLTGISSTFYPNTYAPNVPVQKATVVKARIVRNGFSPGPVTTHTYFIGTNARPNFMLVSISIDEDLLFSYEDGIYVAGKDFDDWRSANPERQMDGFTPANYQRDVERRGHIEIFDGNGSQRVIDQDIGVKLSGNVSLYFPEKSIGLFARTEYGQSKIGYPIFPELAQDSYKRLTLRNSGNDNRHTMFRDAATHESVKHLRFGTQAYRPAVVFINGEYWGIHNIREHLDKNYIASKYGADPDDLDLLEPPEVSEGDPNHYQLMFEYLQSHDLSIEENYQHILTLIDVDNFTDYQIAEIFAANNDWPGRNVRLWRSRTADIERGPASDGRWRWLLKDMDMAYGLGVTFRHNALKAATNAQGEALPNPWWSTLLFRKLLENTGYREKFITRFADLLNTTFRNERLESVINRIKTRIAPEIPDHIQRWNEPASLNNWNGHVSTMIEFVRSRPAHQWQHLQSHFGLKNIYDLTLNVSGTEKGMIRINTIDLAESTEGVTASPYPWTGRYFEGVPILISPVARPGYRFIRWSEIDSEPDELKIDLTENRTITAVFASETDNVTRHSPYHGEANVAAAPEFKWISRDMSTYDLQVSTSDDFHDIVADKQNVSGSRIILEATLQYDTEYFWRMKLHGSSEWTESWRFITMTAPTTSPVVGVEESSAVVSLYPNPTQGLIVITVPPGNSIGSMELYDVAGKLSRVLPVPSGDGKYYIELRNQAKGFYIIVIKNDSGMRIVKKILIN